MSSDRQRTPISREDAALLIHEIRSGDAGAVSHKTLAINLVWSFYDLSQEVDFSKYDLTDEEVDEIIESVPTSFDEEFED